LHDDDGSECLGTCVPPRRYDVDGDVHVPIATGENLFTGFYYKSLSHLRYTEFSTKERERVREIRVE